MPESGRCRACGSIGLIDMGFCAPFPASLAGDLDEGELDAGRLMRCENCGLGQRQPCLQGEALSEMYRKTPADAMDYPFEDNAAWVVARRIVEQRWPPIPGRCILDIGCHTGLFLAGLPSSWVRFGVESAEEPREIASTSHGVQIIADRLESVDPAWAGKFDVVTLFDVAEHLADPAAGLATAAMLVKPGGLLLVSTADMDAWTWKWMGARHWYLQTPLHLSVLSRRFLGHIEAKSGFRLEKTIRIPHRVGDLRTRWRDRIETIYSEFRERGGWYRIPRRLLHSIPGLRQLRHRTSVPWSMHLTDHLLAVMVRMAPGPITNPAGKDR